MRAGESAPRDHGVARVRERTIDSASQHREIIRVFAPRDGAIQLITGVELAQDTRRDVEELHAIAGFTVDVDDHGEERAIVAPGEIGNVAKGDVGPLLEIAHDEIRAAAFRVARCITTQRDVGSILADRERRDVREDGRRARLEVDDADLVARQIPRRCSAPAPRPCAPPLPPRPAPPRPVVSGVTVNSSQRLFALNTGVLPNGALASLPPATGR